MKKNTYKNIKKNTSSNVQKGFFLHLTNGMYYLFASLEKIAFQYTVYVLYVVFLSLLYIFKTHYFEYNMRTVHQLSQEVENLKVDYMTHQSTYMTYIRQSTIAQKVVPYGLSLSKEPPHTIIIDFLPDDEK